MSKSSANAFADLWNVFVRDFVRVVRTILRTLWRVKKRRETIRKIIREKRRQTSHNIIPQRFISLRKLDESIPVVALFLVGSHLRKPFRFYKWIGKNSMIDLREFDKRYPKLASPRFRVFGFEFVDSD